MAAEIGTATIRVKLDLDDFRAQLAAIVDALPAEGTGPAVGDVLTERRAAEVLDSLPVGSEFTDRDSDPWKKMEDGWRCGYGVGRYESTEVVEYAPLTISHLPEPENIAPPVAPAPAIDTETLDAARSIVAEDFHIKDEDGDRFFVIPNSRDDLAACLTVRKAAESHRSYSTYLSADDLDDLITYLQALKTIRDAS